LEKIQPRVTQARNEKLLAPFSEEDVKKVVFSIGDLKVPRPDGLHAIFTTISGVFVALKLFERFYNQ
jgi:hypothetical protein